MNLVIFHQLNQLILYLYRCKYDLERISSLDRLVSFEELNRVQQKNRRLLVMNVHHHEVWRISIFHSEIDCFVDLDQDTIIWSNNNDQIPPVKTDLNWIGEEQSCYSSFWFLILRQLKHWNRLIWIISNPLTVWIMTVNER